MSAGIPSLPSLPTVVTVCWFRNPLSPVSLRRISQATVLGNDAEACLETLETGALYGPASECLLANGFQLVTLLDFGIYGFSVFTSTPEE
ncbi:hypothetical protein [Bacillus infantis]|uniref:Uncharacterized protein n=1 Tax=Bacillus infantis TaxID=324767 RepID=A0A5D4R978_9BACI|nr:hypothetical protein [Bacillus infantis]TYS46781.1 hypothetical protein FZD51_15020 [Bacillus infantis]